MNRRSCFLVTLAVGAALAGCIPEKRVVWAPDGSRAAVIATDGLRICGPSGRLTKPLAPDVRRVGWFTDSRHLLCLLTTKARTWSEAEKIVTPGQRERVVKAAGELRDQLLAYNGPFDKF